MLYTSKESLEHVEFRFRMKKYDFLKKKHKFWNFSDFDPKGGPFALLIWTRKNCQWIPLGLWICFSMVFFKKSYFFILNLNSTCSKLFFDVHNIGSAQNFQIFTFLAITFPLMITFIPEPLASKSTW